MMKNISQRHLRIAEGFVSQSGAKKAKMDNGSLSYKFPEPVAPRKKGLMFSRGFIRFSTSVDTASMPYFTPSREIIAASNYHSTKRVSKANQEATC
jgi:hypothetical protein